MNARTRTASLTDAATAATSSARRAPLAARLVMQQLQLLEFGQLQLDLPDGSSPRFGTSCGGSAPLAVHQWLVFGCKVNNTLNEPHAIPLTRESSRPVEQDAPFQARKGLPASQSYGLPDQYRFSLADAAQTQPASIYCLHTSGPLVRTGIAGGATPLGAGAIARALLAHPLLTLGVMARIHWQALRLWLRRVPVHARPLPPLHKVTR